jgi:hypothetical protein
MRKCAFGLGKSCSLLQLTVRPLKKGKEHHTIKPSLNLPRFFLVLCNRYISVAGVL